MSHTPRIDLDQDEYLAAIAVADMFVDHTYQRELEAPRCRRYADDWNRRLVGIVAVSDRGPAHQPRYAIVDGQHRCEAARLRDPAAVLVANVHSGLSVADEAGLFDKLNRQRKQPNSWAHWRARRQAGDPQVSAIDATARRHHLAVDMSTADGCVACVSALETVVRIGGPELLDSTLALLTAAWDGRRDSLDAPIIGGLALVLRALDNQIDHQRLTECLRDTLPHHIKAKAGAIGELTSGTKPRLTALAIMTFYNKRPGRKIKVTTRTFGGGAVNARSARPAPAPAAADERAHRPAAPPTATARPHRGAEDTPRMVTVVSEHVRSPAGLPSALPPPRVYTDADATAVEDMADQPVADIAQALGLAPRTVRVIFADLGLGKAV